MNVQIKRELMEVFNTIASSYAYSRRRPWRLILDELSGVSGRIADIGCGPGQYSTALLRKPRIEVVCIDFSFEMLRIACKRLVKNDVYGKAHLVQADIENLPFRNNAFDSAIYVATIHHLPTHNSRLRSLREIFRTLKPKAKIVVTAWSILQLRFFRILVKNALLKIVKPDIKMGDAYVPWKHKGKVLKRFYHLFLPWELMDLCREAGFEILKAGGCKVKAKVFPENYYVVGLKRK